MSSLSHLTPNEIQSLETFRTTDELGALHNILKKDCIRELLNSDEAIDRYNRLILQDQHPLYPEYLAIRVETRYGTKIRFQSFDMRLDEMGAEDFDDFSVEQKMYMIQIFLSRTKDDKCDCCGWDDSSYQHEPGCKSLNPIDVAVMPFLDVETKEFVQAKKGMEGTENVEEARYLADYILNAHAPQTLDHLLYREFTETLRLGKSFDKALKAITKLYVSEIYLQGD